MIWITRTMQFYKLKSWRVDLSKDSIDRGFAYLLQLCFQKCHLSSRWFGCFSYGHQNRIQRTTAAYEVWELQLIYTSLPVRLVPDPKNTFLSHSFQIDCVMQIKLILASAEWHVEVTWASDVGCMPFQLARQESPQPCFYVHHLAMIERPW